MIGFIVFGLVVGVNIVGSLVAIATGLLTRRSSER